MAVPFARSPLSTTLPLPDSPDSTLNSPPTTRRLTLGCIADDVTGATDLATALAQGGLRVLQVFGTDGVDTIPADRDVDAVVLALKTRSVPVEEAVSRSLRAFSQLSELGAERFYFKYCSTFDSTSDGNIGPVTEALMDALGVRQTLYCPAFPEAGRTVFNGHLFVGQQLLHESPLKDHPLNPMTDASLIRHLQQQVSGAVGLLPHDVIDSGPDAIRSVLQQLSKEGVQHVIVDTCHDQHLSTISRVAGAMKLVTGGSGLAAFLPENYQSQGLASTRSGAAKLPQVSGRAAVIAGSCSAATVAQVADWKDTGLSWDVDVQAVMKDAEQQLQQLTAWLADTEGRPVLICSSATPERVSQLQTEFGATTVAHALEDFLSRVAVLLASEYGVRRFVVAGGETSGAVTAALGVTAVRIGPNICPGVPWTESLQERPLALALKSGNFGDRQFFTQALEMLP